MCRSTSFSGAGAHVPGARIGRSRLGASALPSGNPSESPAGAGQVQGAARRVAGSPEPPARRVFLCVHTVGGAVTLGGGGRLTVTGSCA